MTLAVSETMFPQTTVEIRDMDFVYTAMGIFAGAALLYWLLFLRTWPLIRVSASTAPEGITAGELGTRLTRLGLGFPQYENDDVAMERLISSFGLSEL